MDKYRCKTFTVLQKKSVRQVEMAKNRENDDTVSLSEVNKHSLTAAAKYEMARILARHLEKCDLCRM